MKHFKIILLFLVSLLNTSCEDVIELELPESEKRVVVDAWINNVREIQEVKLSYTGPYFDSTPMPRITGASVMIHDDQGNAFTMFEDDPGIYRHAFTPQIGNVYTLTITTSEGTQYMSHPERMEEVPEMTELYYTYKTASIFDDEGYYVFFGLNDPPGVKNFYRWKYFINGEHQNTPEYFIFDNDDLLDGAEIPDIQFNNSPLEELDNVRIEQHSITENAYNFLFLVREQITSGRGTFDAPPAPIKGNIFNVHNPNETVLGYFGASDVDFKEIRIENQD